MEAQAVRVSLQLKPDLRIVLYDGAKEWYKSVIRFETQDSRRPHASMSPTR